MNKRKTANKYLNKLKDGDYSVFDDFFRCFYGFIWEVGNYYLKDKSCSDDVVQLTFETVLNHLSDFNDSMSGYAWMVQIAKNHALMLARQNKKYDKNKEVEDFLDNGEDLDADHDKISLHIALEKLDPHYRKIVEYNIFEDMTLRNIAKKLGMTYYEAYRDYHAALKMLSEILEEP